jgi:hypothetical protein
MSTAGATAALPRWRTLAARGVLLLGVLTLFALLAPNLPREQTLVLRVPKGAPVKSISVTLTPLGDAAPTAGFTLKYPDGAPQRIEHRTSLPNGEYDVELALERQPHNQGDVERETKYHRRIQLEGGATNIRLRDEP